jgi:hypothetical protein
MNDTGKNTNQKPKIKSQAKSTPQPKSAPPTPPTSPTPPQEDTSSYLDVVLSLNNIVPVITIIIVIMIISRILIINGLDRYFNLNDISIPTEEIKYTILKIIGIFIFISSIAFLLYYFVSSPVFTHSFRFTDVRTNFSLLNTIYSIFFVIAVGVVMFLPVLTGIFDIESNQYKNYVGVVGALLVYSMFLYSTIQNKEGLTPDGMLYKKLGLFTFFISILVLMVATTLGNQQWFFIFAGMMIFFFIITAILYGTKLITSETSNNMKWIPKTMIDKLIYFLVFVPLKIMYYYPYIFIQYIIPGIYSLFFSSTIFIYTIIFILGMVMMKTILPYFDMTFGPHVYLAWIGIYCIMLYTNKLVNSSSTFFSMRQGFLFLCLLLIFLAYLFFMKRSGTMPEYLKLYITSFVFVTGIIAVFLFFYMAKAEQKEFSDCDLYKNIFPPSFTNLNTQEKINGVIPTLKMALLAYIAVCVSCYVLIYIANKLFPMESGLIGQITGIIIVILILMIFISLFVKLRGESGMNFKVSASFTDFIFSLLSFLVEFVFYIPCKLHDIISSIGSANSNINKTTIFFIILDILFILLYIYGSYIRKYIYINGLFPNISHLLGISSWIPQMESIPNLNRIPNLDVKFPISIKEYDMNVSNLVAKSNEETMNNTENTIYNYSLSFWFFIDTNTPSASIAYSTYTPILSYGTTPVIMYNYLKQSMIITSRSDNPFYPSLDPREINDPNGRYENSNLKIIYETKNIPLQKWTNLVILYNSSVVDIFINGELVKSNISLSPSPSEHIHNPDIPQIISLIAGSENGINGKLCNIVYYDKKIGLEQIERLYVSVKDNNPPIFYPSLL